MSIHGPVGHDNGADKVLLEAVLPVDLDEVVYEVVLGLYVDEVEGVLRPPEADDVPLGLFVDDDVVCT
jgi:hypothetical protein